MNSIMSNKLLYKQKRIVYTSKQLGGDMVVETSLDENKRNIRARQYSGRT